MRKTVKTFIAALLLGSASFALTPQVHAAPTAQPSTPNQELNWIDRASQNYDGGGY